MTAILDLLPLLAFFIVSKAYGLVAGAGAVMAATIAVAAIHAVRQKGKLTKQQWVVLLMTVVFCSATLLLRDDVYLRWKTPIINLIFALTLGVSALMGVPLLKFAMQNLFVLSQRAWLRLSWAWAAFFLFLAGIHYWIGLYAYDAASEDSRNLFINFKSYGQLILTAAFILAQFWLLRRHLNPELDKDDKKPHS